MRSLMSFLGVAQAPNTISAQNTNPRSGPMSLNITQGIILPLSSEIDINPIRKQKLKNNNENLLMLTVLSLFILMN